MKDKLVTLLDDSFAEFDRLMRRTLEMVAQHAELSADYNTLLARHEACRAQGAGFVVEAAMAIRDIRRDAA